MLNRSPVRAVVAPIAILISAALSNDALAAFTPGDVITYIQGMWGSDPRPTGPAGLLLPITTTSMRRRLERSRLEFPARLGSQ